MHHYFLIYSTDYDSFFRTRSKSVIATEADHKLSKEEISELSWLYGDAEPVDNDQLEGYFVGPRREMVTPWSTNAVEITQNMALKGISRIEEYFPVDTPEADHDPMLQRMYDGLDQQIFTIDHDPEPIKRVDASRSSTRRRASPSRPRRSPTSTR